MDVSIVFFFILQYERENRDFGMLMLILKPIQKRILIMKCMYSHSILKKKTQI